MSGAMRPIRTPGPAGRDGIAGAASPRRMER